MVAQSLMARPQVVPSTTWTAIGPSAVNTPEYGLVSGRVTALALDPADATGNTLYVGTTGGGLWRSINAGSANAVFTPLTDDLEVNFEGAEISLSDATDASISIGAVTVQPGGTGVILAGTGDPNDALDSYFGAGILYSADGGKSWSLIPYTADGLFGFDGEGFAGFAWGPGTGSTQTVVAAVTESYQFPNGGALVNAVEPGLSYQGLYYSTDAGATWHLARITDGNGADVQGPNDAFGYAYSNAATSVVWNPAWKLFIAAVQFHGYYQSPDGKVFTRMAAQPGSGLTLGVPNQTNGNCPTNSGGMLGSTSCPIFRGTLAVNPQTGDTFAWTTDVYNQDQGIWQDKCQISNGVCTTQGITFGTQLNSSQMEVNAAGGDTRIQNGDYTLALAALPAGALVGEEDTILVAGAVDLWKCSLAAGCLSSSSWRNTTNATTCMSGKVSPYQHALAWSTAAGTPVEIFAGNDGGLWLSPDGLGYTDLTDPVCSANDANHFENLNGGLGSLAEVVSMSQTGNTQYTLMAGLGVNGTAGVKSASLTSGPWQQILGGYGGPVAVDPLNHSNWYVNNQGGVSIYQNCFTVGGQCVADTPTAPVYFGTQPVVDDSDVGGDGYTMATEGYPAALLVDPLDPMQLLVGTCRLWRGPASGQGWSAANAVSPILDQPSSSGPCSGNSLIRTIAVQTLPNSATHTLGGEVVYVGMYGAQSAGGNASGHVWTASYDTASSTWSTWTDRTGNTVAGDTSTLNSYGFDISSIFIDEHDQTGNTVYVTVEGEQSKLMSHKVTVLYLSTNGGASWTDVDSNLPWSPGNSVVVDPQDANTVYVALDAGVWSTRTIGYCGTPATNCWSPYGSGLPTSPVTQLSASPATSSAQALVAGTYGRGVWQIPLQTAGVQPSTTTASISPSSWTYPLQLVGISSSTGQKVFTITNTGSNPLTTTSVVIGAVNSPNISDSANFQETDTCQGYTVLPNGTCEITVTFAPQTPLSPATTLTFNDTMTIFADVSGGQLSTVALTGSSTAPPVSLSTGTINFNVGTTNNGVLVGSPSAQFSLSISNNSHTTAITLAPFTNSGTPFSIVSGSNTCGSTLAANSACSVLLVFTPTVAGAATGTLSFSYQMPGAPSVTETVNLTGTGLAPATDTLSASSLAFPDTVEGVASSGQGCTTNLAANVSCTITLSNTGGVNLNGISVSTSGANGAFSETNSCTATLGPGLSCSITVVFTPNLVGAESGTLTITDARQTQTVSLTGTGLQPPAFSLSATTLTFPTENEGQSSPAQTLTIGNSGAAPLNLTATPFTISGPSASSFSCGTTICSLTTCGTSLAAGANCTVQLIFSPTSSGTNTATLTISAANAQAVQVQLNGPGVAAAGLNITPAALNFSLVFTGQSSAVQMVTVTNTGNATLSVPVFQLTGADAFSVTQNSCTGSLSAGAACTIGVIFSPSAIGAAAGMLTATSGTQTGNVALTGTGAVSAAIVVTPSPIPPFAITGVGSASSATTLTISNPGSSQDLSGLALVVTGGFQLANNNCTGTLAAGASCTVGLEFAPVGGGAQTGSLTVSSTTVPVGGAVPLSVILPLSGTGFNFTLTPSGSATQTVAAGSKANYALTITPTSGLSGSFVYVLSCGVGLPSNTTCTFPGSTGNSVTIVGSNTDSVTVQMSTTSSTARLSRPGGWAALPLLCGLVLLPFGWRRPRRLLLLLVMTAIITGGVCSCSGSGGGTGGGGGGGGGGGSTPAGTYTIPISATSMGVTQSVNVTLTVD